jgi:hypothetical protein
MTNHNVIIRTDGLAWDSMEIIIQPTSEAAASAAARQVAQLLRKKPGGGKHYAPRACGSTGQKVQALKMRRTK